MTDPHAELAPSQWVERWCESVPPGGTVLDVACGRGRHARFFAARGHAVTAVDRDAACIEALAKRPGISAVRADLESGEWPFPGRLFDAVVVTNYLYRPLLPILVAAIRSGGVLIYETFAAGNERYGRPSNPDFLLRPGELLDLARGVLQVVAFEQLDLTEPRPAAIQRICAVRPAPRSSSG